MDSYFKIKAVDRINKIVRIERPSAEGRLAAGEKRIHNILYILSNNKKASDRIHSKSKPSKRTQNSKESSRLRICVCTVFRKVS
jgi:hypothetical protein